MRVVLDTSAAANIVLRTELAPSLIETLRTADLVLAPSLFHSEVANTLWKYVGSGELDVDGAIARHEEAIALVDAFEADDQLAVEALSTAARMNHPVYDLLYVILARRFGCRLMTTDRKLAALAASIDENMPL